jgi:hypothetical protein
VYHGARGKREKMNRRVEKEKEEKDRKIMSEK